MPRLHVIEGPLKGRTFDLTEEVVFIGRSAKNDIQIKDATISRKQVKVFRIGKKTFVEDLKSTNPTAINGKPILPGEGFEVVYGDVISVGSTAMRLEDLTGSAVPPLYPGTGQMHRRERRARNNKDLEVTFRVTELLRQSLDVGQFCTDTLGYLLDALPRVDRAAVILLDETGEETAEVFSRSREGVGNPAPLYSRKVVEQVLGGGKAVRMSNTIYEGPESLSETIHRLEIRSILCVPLISNSKVRGCIYLDSIRGPYGFRKADLLLLNSLSGQVAVAVENAVLQSRLEGRPRARMPAPQEAAFSGSSISKSKSKSSSS